MIQDTFDNTTLPVLGPQDFYKESKHLCDTCIATFSKQIAQFVLKNFKHEKVGEILCANGGTPVYLIHHNAHTFAFYLSRIGSALSGADVVDANYLTGATRFLFFGSAGSLDQEATTGKYVLATEAYRDEGLSYHYAPPADFITIKNAEKLAEYFTEWSLPFVTGRVWTTDAFYRETRGNVKKRKDAGCLAVEMELAGLQAVCDYHGFSLYDFLVTGDVLDAPEYDVADLWNANHDTEKFLLALRIAERITDDENTKATV